MASSITRGEGFDGEPMAKVMNSWSGVVFGTPEAYLPRKFPEYLVDVLEMQSAALLSDKEV